MLATVREDLARGLRHVAAPGVHAVDVVHTLGKLAVVVAARLALDELLEAVLKLHHEFQDQQAKVLKAHSRYTFHIFL